MSFMSWSVANLFLVVLSAFWFCLFCLEFIVCRISSEGARQQYYHRCRQVRKTRLTKAGRRRQTVARYQAVRRICLTLLVPQIAAAASNVILLCCGFFNYFLSLFLRKISCLSWWVASLFLVHSVYVCFVLPVASPHDIVAYPSCLMLGELFFPLYSYYFSGYFHSLFFFFSSFFFVGR